MDEQEIQGIPGEATPTSESDEPKAPVPSAEQQSANDQGSDGSLPEDSSDRTRKEFAKLKAHNLEMAAKLKAYEKKEVGENVFDYLSGQAASNNSRQSNVVDTPNLSQGQVNQIAQSFVDPYGNVDIDKLNATLAQANRLAEEAKKEAREAKQGLAKVDEERQVAEAHAKYSWLDPKSDQFDRKAFDYVKNALYADMVEGRKRSLSQVAAEFDAYVKPKVDVAVEKDKAVEDYKKAQTTKQQVNTVTQGKGQPRVELTHDELRARSMAGDQAATDARIARAISGK